MRGDYSSLAWMRFDAHFMLGHSHTHATHTHTFAIGTHSHTQLILI